MAFVFVTSLGRIEWEEGKLTGQPLLIRQVKKYAGLEESVGNFHGIQPFTGLTEGYLDEEYAAFGLVTSFFELHGITAEILREPPPIEPPPSGPE